MECVLEIAISFLNFTMWKEFALLRDRVYVQRSAVVGIPLRIITLSRE